MSPRVLLLSVAIGMAALFMWVSRAAAPGEHAAPVSPTTSRESQAVVPRPLESPNLRPTDLVDRTPAERGEPHGARLRGHVRDPEGAGIPDATVWVHTASVSVSPETAKGPEPPPPIPMATARTDVDGGYELSLPLRIDTYVVDVGARAHGFVRTIVEGTEIAPGEAATLDIALHRGESIVGRVVRSGRAPSVWSVPTKGLAVVATKGRPTRRDAMFSTDFEVDCLAFANATRNSGVDMVRAEVGPEGEFTIDGLTAGDYSLHATASDRGLLVFPSIVVRSGTRDVLIEVVPASRFELRVTEDGKPVDRFSCSFALATRGSSSLFMTGRAGWLAFSLDLERMVQHPVGRPATMNYTIRAPGYTDRHGSIEFDPAAAVVRHDVDLGGMALDLVPVFVDAAFVDGPLPSGKRLLLRYSAANSADVRQTTVDWVGHRLVAKLPPGTWWIKVLPEGRMGWANVVEAEVLVGPAGGEVLGLRFQRTGSLRVLSDRTIVVQLVGAGFAGQWEIPAGGTTIDDVPPGDWLVAWLSGGTQRVERAVVTAGGESVVAVGR